MADYPDPTIYATPFFVVSLVVEAVLLARRAKQGRAVIGYARNDTLASLAMGIGSLVTVTALNLGVFLLASWLYPHRFVDVGHGVLAWATAIVGWDFGFYWHHRLEHENRIFWANHVNHHSSRHFNLSTALRQPWTPITVLFFYPPLALLGVPPWMIMVSGGVNLIYQFWIHTELVRKFPRPIEWVLNTPSHHRVHHASNPEYLDRNYAGVLIVWDRLFGTFEAEGAPVVYGLTKNIDSFNPFVIAFHEYAALARDVRKAPTWRRRGAILWHGPGWHADASKPRGPRG